MRSLHLSLATVLASVNFFGWIRVFRIAEGFGFAPAPPPPSLVPVSVAAPLPLPLAPAPFFPPPLYVVGPDPTRPPFFCCPPPIFPPAYPPPYPPGYGIASALLNALFFKKAKFLGPPGPYPVPLPPPLPPFPFPGYPPVPFDPAYPTPQFVKGPPKRHIVDVYIKKDYVPGSNHEHQTNNHSPMMISNTHPHRKSW